ncbi:MAG: hypothetical protein AB7O57_21055 [Hyphomicrobiaceae bacterium]
MRMQIHMHIDPIKASFPELDALRCHLRLSQSYVCREAAINPATYTRWRKWAIGRGGHCPQSSSLRNVRSVLAKELERARAE